MTRPFVTLGTTLILALFFYGVLWAMTGSIVWMGVIALVCMAYSTAEFANYQRQIRREERRSHGGSR